MCLESREDLREIVAACDAEVQYMDHHVGRILSTLREFGLYEESLIIVTADHGEEFGEHGVYGEHWSTYDGTQRVPLLMKPPSGSDATPSRRDQLVTNVDMASTIADYAGLEPANEWQG